MSKDAHISPEINEMSQVSIELSPSARNDVSRILGALASVKNADLAEHLNVDPSTFSRMKNEKKSNGLTEIENACELFSKLGLKVVPKKYKMISRERLSALLEMSRSWMKRIDSVDDLFQDDIDDLNLGEKLGYDR